MSTNDMFINKKLSTAFTLQCAAVALMWASMVLPNALYDGMISTEDWSLTQVALIYTMQIFTIFLAAPFCGALTRYISSRKVLSYGLIAAGLLNCFVPLSSNSYPGIVVIHVIKGTFLSPCQIVTRSLVAKYYTIECRSTKYGKFELSAGIGGLIGVLFGALSFINGSDGFYGTLPKWGFSYLMLGSIYFPIAYLIHKYVFDPDHDQALIQIAFGAIPINDIYKGMNDGDVKLEKSSVQKLCSNKTWIVVCLQGVTGAMPWPALGLLLYYFQLMQIDDFLAIFISSAVAIGAALGGFIGGKLGDYAYKRNPKYGRIIVSHVSVTVGVPLVAVYLYCIPVTSNWWPLYAALGVFTGTLISWSAPCNIAMLSDTFDKLTFPFAYGVEQMLEGAIAAWAPTMVAAFATSVFGVTDLQDFDLKTDEERVSDINGLGNSMFIICATGWGLCSLSMFGMYYTYPNDSRSLRESHVNNVEMVSEPAPAEIVHADPETNMFQITVANQDTLSI